MAGNLNLEDYLKMDCGQAFMDAMPEEKALLNQLDQEGLIAKQRAKVGSKKATGWDMAFEFYVNGLLSRPSTQGVNIVSNMVPVSTRVFESLTAVTASKLFRNEADRLLYDEVWAEAKGLAEGFREAFAFVGHRLKGVKHTNEQLLEMHGLPEELAIQAKIERQNQAISGRNVNTEWLKKTADYTGFGINVPGKFLTNADLFFKIINYRAEIAKQSMRSAVTKHRETGRPLQEIYEEIKDRALSGQQADIIKKGIDDADRRTYTNRPDTKLDQWFAEKGHDVPGLRWVAPFRRTMVNLVSYGVGRSPLSPVFAALGTVPGVAKSPTYMALRHGTPAEKADAIGRIASGTAMLTGLAYTLGDRLNGDAPRDPQLRDLWQKNGNEAYTVKIGDSNLRLDALGGYGIMLKSWARYQQLMSNADFSDPEQENAMWEATALMTVALGDVVMNEHWMRNIVQGTNAIDKAIRHDEMGPIGIYLSQIANSFAVPGIIQEGRKLVDPHMKDIDGYFDAFQSKVPWLSELVEDKIDLWGNPMRYDHWLDPEIMHPVTGDDEVAKELLLVGTPIPRILRTHQVYPGEVGSPSIKYTKEEYQYLHIVRGKGDPALGMPPLRDALMQRMQSRIYRNAETDLAKRVILNKVLQQYNELAKKSLMGNPAFDYTQRLQVLKEDYKRRATP